MSRGSPVNLFGVGYGNADRSLNVTASSRVNVYYDIQPSPGDKSQIAVFNTPGLVNQALFDNQPTGKIKEIYVTGNGGQAYYIIGNSFCVGESGAQGTFATGLQENPELTDNFVDVVIAHGGKLYAWQYIGPSTLTNVQFLGTTTDIRASSVTFMDGYVIAAVQGDGTTSPKVYVSGLYDARSWSQLDYAVPEFKTDNIVKVKALNGLLYVFGDYSTEIWQNVGDPNYPFQPIQGAKSNYGLVRKESLVAINDKMVGLFRNDRGMYSILVVSGMQYQDITPPDLSNELNSEPASGTVTNLASYEQPALTYSVSGHEFYQITITKNGSTYKTFLYDLLSGAWSTVKSGALSRSIGFRSFLYYGSQYMTDYRSTASTVFRISESAYADDGVTNTRELIGNHIFMPDRSTFTIRSMSLDMEHGVDTNPLTVYLSLSRDGGHTFGEEYSDTSTSGDYTRFFQFNRLGRGRDIVPKIRTQDPCKFVLIGAVADIAPYGW